MNLIVDIGNTQMKTAVYEGGVMRDFKRFGYESLSNLNDWISRHSCTSGILCQVGKARPEIFQILQEHCETLLTMNRAIRLPVRIAYKTPSTLGYDRIAAVSGAYKIAGDRDLLVIDMGTAITLDHLSKYGEFTGGNISPGLDLRYKALHSYTANLPLLEKQGQYPMFGDTTDSAIIAGVQKGILYELEGYLRDFHRMYPKGFVMATGGDAEFLLKHSGLAIEIFPHLTLEGLNYILEINSL